jgi:hypothetical protein
MHGMMRRFFLPASLFVLLACFLFFKGLCLFFEHETRNGKASDWTPRKLFWSVCLISALNMALYWIPVFPSGTSPDTRDQWDQIHGTQPYSNIHAIGHTIFLKLLLHIVDSYAVVILVHILIVSFMLAVFARYVYRKGAKTYWVLLLTVLFTSCVSSGEAFLFPWKDTPYALCIAAVTYFIMRSLDAGYTPKTKSAVLLGAALAFSAIFRYNGMVTLLVCSAYFGIYFLKRKELKILAITALTMVFCFVSIHFYAYGILKTQSPSNPYAIQVFAMGVSAVVANDGDITEVQSKRIVELLPVDIIKEKYKPWYNEKLLWESPFNQSLTGHRREIVKIYFELLPRNLLICAKDIAYNTVVVWGVRQKGANFFYSNIFLCLVLACAAAVSWDWASFKKRWVVFLPVLANIVSIAISTITNELRYMLPTFLLFAPLLWYIHCTRNSNNNTL